jgi:hypothetical protein
MNYQLWTSSHHRFKRRQFQLIAGILGPVGNLDDAFQALS